MKRKKSKISESIKQDIKINLPLSKRENTLTENQKILLNYLHEAGSMKTTKKFLAEKTGVKTHNISNCLKALEKKGYIIYETEYLVDISSWVLVILVFYETNENINA